MKSNIQKEEERKQKVMLLFPPEWVPTAPYIALPCLTAVLRQNGYQVVQKDVNIEMYHLFFSKPFLMWIKERLSKKLQELKASGNARILTDLETKQKTTLLTQLAVDVLDLTERVESAKRITQTEDFYDSDKLEWALNTFREVMQYISAAYYPASLLFYPMESNLSYRPGVAKDVLACIEDEQVNVFREVCRQIVLPAVKNNEPDLIGISIGTKVQLLAGLTFCKMIKEAFPNIHITVGGNVITRLQEDLPRQKQFFTSIFDSAIIHEGEHSLLWLLEALEGEREWTRVPNLIYSNKDAIQANKDIYTEKIPLLPIPDFDGFPLDSYFVPERILPYLATRGCYWGRCTFCDHGQGYLDQYRAKSGSQVVEEIKALKEKYHVNYFLFPDESYPPALFKKVAQLLVEQAIKIKWTTPIRFEETLQDPEVWQLAVKAGCRALYFGMESANERVLDLMHKHVKKQVIEKNLHESAKAGIWNHVMAIYGFPGETLEEAEETRQFLLDNKDYIHSLEMSNYVAYRHSPIVRNPEKFGVTIHKQDEYDIPLDYYYTLNHPSSLSCQEAMQLCEELYSNDFEPWAVRINAREHVLLYVSKFGTNQLPQIYANSECKKIN